MGGTRVAGEEPNVSKALSQVNQPREPREQLEIAFCCDGYALGSVGNVLFSTTSLAPPLSVYDEADQLSERLLKKYPGGICHLIVAAEGLPMPTPERRARIAQSTRRFDGRTRAIAMVFAGTGLWSTSMRMVGNAMMMVIPSKCERRMFGDVTQAVLWLTGFFPRELASYGPHLKQVESLLRDCPQHCSCPRAGQLRGA